MLLITRQVKGIPVAFAFLLLLMIVLTIFFGAWAVSVDADTRGGQLYLGAVGEAPSLNVIDPDSPLVVAPDQEQSSAADEWWGKALLKACPFH